MDDRLDSDDGKDYEENNMDGDDFGGQGHGWFFHRRSLYMSPNQQTLPPTLSFSDSETR